VPQDEEGLLDLDAILAAPRVHTLIYCCGPEPLLKAVEEHATRWPAGALKIERFTAKAIDTEGDESFDLVLDRTGVSVRVAPDQTVFDAMRAAGVAVLGSCLEGICGTCETAVLEGEVDHRDSVLEPDEQEAMDAMMVCVSRARGDRLVLDA
jgi:ferredoxin